MPGRRFVACRLAAAILVAGCVQAPAAGGPTRSVITHQADGLRTFSISREMDGRPTAACPFFGLAKPLSGILRADPAAGMEPMWIDVAGRRASVVWPEGFTLRFEPDGVLYDDHGEEVGRDGSHVTLEQVDPTGHTGTFDDPYIASGLLFGTCYPFTP